MGGLLTITPRPVTVTADAKTKVYGDADPAPLTYAITTGSLAFSDVFAGSLARDPGENVGDYDITQGSLALSTNYTLTYVSAKLSITPRPVTATADAKTKIYGDADPALTYQISSGNLVGSDAFSGGADSSRRRERRRLCDPAGDARAEHELHAHVRGSQSLRDASSDHRHRRCEDEDLW